MAITIINSDGSVNISGTDENLKISSNDTTADFLENKLAEGSNVTLTVLNEGANEQIEIAAIASAGADTVSVSANDTTPGNLDAKLVAGTNITLTENNDGGNETLTIDAAGGDAGDVTYTPAILANWTGSADPGNADAALDQLASRLVTIENQVPQDASTITYTPNELTDWDSDLDPGDANDALDQLAERLSLVEAGTVAPDASQVTYTPSTLAHWGGVDPGDADDALDFLANKIETGLDASGILYTPAVLADWDSSSDPGDTNDALDQLAERVADLEGAGGVGTAKVSSDDTTANFLENKIVGTGLITVTTTNPAGNEGLQISASVDAADVSYSPNDVSDWNSSLDPGNTDDAIDQLADRLKVVELATVAPNASEITYTPAVLSDWDGNADPGDVDNALDQLAERVDDNENTFSSIEFRAKVSSNDTTGNYLQNKIVAGTGITVSVLNEAGDEDLQINNAFTDIADLSYTPSTLTDWSGDVDPGDADDALDQLASRVETLEGAIVTDPDATDVTYTPNDNTDWNGDLDPGNVDGALDQLAERVDTLEAGLDASLIGYVPATLGDWNSSTDPGQVDDALDQLADRVKTIEDEPAPDASNVTYTPAVLTDWDSDTDPGDVDGALDQLAERVDDLEAGSGATPDASGVTYTPNDLTDWTGDADPGNVDDALDQLADRVDVLEGSGASLTGFFAQDTVIDQSRTIPTEHQAIYVGEVEVISGGEIIVEGTGELIILPDTTFDRVDKIDYVPDDLTDWTGDSDPGNASDALDQLAGRVQTLEDSGIALSDIYTFWDTDAPPISAGSIDDEFDDGSVDAAWLSYDFGSKLTSVTEDTLGMTFRATTTNTSEPVWFGRYKALPGGDFTIYTKVHMNNITENGGLAGLALLEDAASATGNVEFFGLLAGVDGFIVSRTYTQYNPTGNTQRTFHGWTPRTVYLRVRRTGTAYSFAHSIDGISWTDHPTSFTPSFTPLHIGLVAGNTLAVTDWRVRFEFFRYVNSNTGPYEALPGRAITVKN